MVLDIHPYISTKMFSMGFTVMRPIGIICIIPEICGLIERVSQ